jgi:threonine dehydrogenase-like Zn-dependent dehydrogenase
VAAKEAGAEKIIVTGLANPTDARRLAMAKHLGAHHTVASGEQDLLETVADLTNGQMADLVIDCASGGPGSVISAMQLARKRGRVILGGIKRKKIPEFDSDMIIARFLTVKGMRGHSFESVELALQLIAGNRHNVREMSTHSFGLDQTEYALRSLVGEGAEDVVHMTIDPWR